LADLSQENFVLQFGGAVGTLSSMETKGTRVAESMGKTLGLKVPPVSWHSSRDRLAQLATTLGILQGNIGKLAEDICLLMQTEISEVFEPPATGKGGSSSMPHKRNPVGCIAILANSKRLPGLVSTQLNCMDGDHERSSGKWHAEWETLSSIVMLTAGSVRQAVVVTNGLEVDTIQMLRNLELTKGLIYAENINNALARHIGKSSAEELVEKACQQAKDQRIHLKEIITKNQEVVQYLSPDQIEALFDPQNSLGLNEEYIDNVLKLI
jgi:3-carboxy-cis,cis-muconate cycloisomerase